MLFVVLSHVDDFGLFDIGLIFDEEDFCLHLNTMEVNRISFVELTEETLEGPLQHARQESHEQQ